MNTWKIKMKPLIRILPSFGAFAWILWFCVQAKWSEVIAPNFWLILLATGLTTIIVWILTRTEKQKTTALVETETDANVVPTERLAAREVYTWRTKTVTRERSVYAKPE